MKGSCTLVTYVLAASTVALSSSSPTAAADGDVAFYPCSSDEGGSPNPNTKTRVSSSDEKNFAPRFDGLRFIETLVTAHR
uniref:Uncharacterized protein n=1 Tax=Rhizophora mucronata TaxID=61149 RepID=A0A2P2QRC0_RHIMU